MKRYIGEITKEGFTISSCHYFVVKLSEQLDDIRRINLSHPITKIYFQSSEMHKYITNCKATNMPIVISGTDLVIPTGFHFIPQTKDANGNEVPLTCTKLDSQTNKYKREVVVMNHIRLFVDEADIKGMRLKRIIYNTIQKVKKHKIQ